MFFLYTLWHLCVGIVQHDESGDVLEAPWFGNGEYSVAEHVQQMLLLNTKLRMNLRLLHSAQQECSTLTHRVCEH